MRILFALLCLAATASVLAQDAPTLLKQAKELESRAEKALDQGRNTEAFELLAQAAAVRERAKRMESAVTGATATPEPAPQAQPQAQPQPKASPARTKKKRKRANRPPAAGPHMGRGVGMGMPLEKALEATFATLESAIESGDRVAALGATRKLRRMASEMTRQLRARPAGGAPRPAAQDPQLRQRLAFLEKQVAELRELVDRLDRPRR